MENHLKTLRSNGYKITPNRKNVLNVLMNNKRPLTLNDIQRLCKKTDFAAIYRVMNLFSSLGIVNEVKLLDKQVHYELMEGDHHHHVICQVCGKIDRIDLCIVSKAQKLTQYKITSHTLEFKGICPDCIDT